MAMIYNNTEDKTDLQRRIAADLHTKNSASLVDKGKVKTPTVEPEVDGDYTKSSPAAMTVMLLIGLIIIVGGVLMYLSGQGK